jgi:hypothetical protein
MIAANDHDAGFGPGTANQFRKMVGLSELSCENRNQLQERLELRKRQIQQLEQDQQIKNSSLNITSHRVKAPISSFL